MKGKKFKVSGFRGTYKVTQIYPQGFLAEAKSDTGGTISLTKNKSSGRWLATKGTKNYGAVRWQ